MRDKDYPAMLDGLLPALDAVLCTQASEPRSLTATELADAVAAAGQRAAAATLPVEHAPDPRAALARARLLAGEKGSVLIGGSLYLLEDLGDVVAGAR
jgi:dihydrofolate synthase/folylpolyglutamate synthase